MDKLKEHVRTLLDIADHFLPDEMARLEKLRFSVTVDEVTNRRLQYCASRLAMNRSSLSAQIIEHSLEVIEAELGIRFEASTSEQRKSGELTRNNQYWGYAVGIDTDNEFAKEANK